MITSISKAAAVSALICASAATLAPQTALAAKKIDTPPACDAALVNADRCSGYYAGNLNGGSPAKIEDQQIAIAALGANFSYDGNFGDLAKIETLTGGNQLDFGTMLYGETIISIHFGNVAGPAGNVTGFYLFDFGTTGASSITLNNTQGFSNAVLFNTGMGGAVPEPAAWMMMILAFGAMGTLLRTGNARKKHATTFSYA